MKSLNTQKGIGIMEVLIAMLVLAIGVFGFIALQARATAATGEALKRSDAMLILQGLAERIRLNPSGNYKATVSNITCTSSACSVNNQAIADLYFYSQQATNKNMTIAVIDCLKTSSNQERLCLVAMWDKTTLATAAEPADSSQSNACLISSGTKIGRYQEGSTCLLMEAY